MIAARATSWLLASLLLLACTSSADAGEKRTKWRYDGGTFENIGGFRWLEKVKGGADFHFVETNRTDDFILLVRIAGENKDARNFIWLYNTHADLRTDRRNEKGKVGKHSDGGWVD